jgi:simple sugar transport system substrate-binding protein
MNIRSQTNWSFRGIAAAFGAVVLAAGLFDAGAVALAQDKPVYIYLGNSTSEPFWQRVIKGFEQAGTDLGFEPVYRAYGQKGIANANEMKATVENALAAKPAGMIIADTRPEAMNEVIKAVVDQGIPVVLANSGFGEQKNVGALAFVGLDEYQNGHKGGELLKETGAKHAVVFTLLPGIPLVDDRTKGFIDGFAPGKTTTVAVAVETLYDTQKLVNALSAAFQKDETIDSAFSIGSCCSPALLIAREQLGDRAKSMHFGTIDLGDPALQGLIDGTLDFALDQQQYMQGYLPAVLLTMYLRYGITPAIDFFPTGPGVVNAKNAKQIIDLSAQNVR